eukprot:scpid95431/ scgid19926/ 
MRGLIRVVSLALVLLAAHSFLRAPLAEAAAGFRDTEAHRDGANTWETGIEERDAADWLDSTRVAEDANGYDTSVFDAFASDPWDVEATEERREADVRHAASKHKKGPSDEPWSRRRR